jgi:pimeloyl-ACP methyl ester carboxylesterase
MDVHEDTICVQSHRLRVQRLTQTKEMDADRLVLVFLHEGLGSIRLWRDFPRIMVEQTGLDALVYDRAGHGESSPLVGSRTAAYLHEEAEQSLPGVLDTYGIRQAILIGHSDGGTIGLIAAAAYPKRISALITEAPHVFVEEITLVGIRKVKEAYEQGDLRSRLEKYHQANTASLFYGWADTWLKDPFPDWSIVDLLPGVQCPVLNIQGENDAYGTVHQLETIARYTSGETANLVIPGCGHSPHAEARGQVVEAMGTFIAAHR